MYGLDLISRTDSGGNQEYYLTDGLGSTTGLANGTGSVLGTYQYDVFGSLRSQTGSSANEFTYTGEQNDPTGLEYLRARYYDNATGRFLTRDPLPLVQRYAYVGNNPANLVDPYGLVPCPGCNVVRQIVTKPVGDIMDTIDYVDTVIDHPESVLQTTLGLTVARLSFGDRFEVDGAVFYENCWGACSFLTLMPAGAITFGHHVFVEGSADPDLILHELTHVRQGDKYGFSWIFRYLSEHSRRGYDCNRFEEEARQAAGDELRCSGSKE